MTRRQRLSAAPGQGPTSQGGPEPGNALRAGDPPFLASQHKRAAYRCGACGKPGHTRKRCRPLPARPGYVTGNANYQLRRGRGLCGDCGRPSKRFARCLACRKRRKRWPSRQTAYRKERGTW